MVAENNKRAESTARTNHGLGGPALEEKLEVQRAAHSWSGTGASGRHQTSDVQAGMKTEMSFLSEKI
jgi:hypothetical protein